MISKYISEQPKITKRITLDGLLATSFHLDFLDSAGNPCEISATRFKSNNQITYSLHQAQSKETLSACETEAVCLLQNQFQVTLSPQYYSEDVLYEPPWKTEYSFSIDGHKFKLVLDYESRWFLLNSLDNQKETSFADQLAVCIATKLMNAEKNGSTDNSFRIPVSEKKPTPPAEAPKPKWQSVYDAAASLHIFKKTYDRYLQEDGYRKLIELLSEKYHNLDIVDQTNPKWEESDRELRITGSYEHWVGHDDTSSEYTEIKFRRLNRWELDDTIVWSTESEWPCQGEYQYIDRTKREGDSWNYSITIYKVWQLKSPFGLPGIWNFECIYTADR